MFCMAFGRAGEPSGHMCTSCPPSMYTIAVVSRKLAAAQQPAVSPYNMWLLADAGGAAEPGGGRAGAGALCARARPAGRGRRRSARLPPGLPHAHARAVRVY